MAEERARGWVLERIIERPENSFNPVSVRGLARDLQWALGEIDLIRSKLTSITAVTEARLMSPMERLETIERLCSGHSEEK